MLLLGWGQDPLVEAARIVSTQIKYAAKVVESHTLAFDVAMKRAKYLLALQVSKTSPLQPPSSVTPPHHFILLPSSSQALLRGKRLRATHPGIFYRIVAFFHNGSNREVHPTVAEVIRCVLPRVAPLAIIYRLSLDSGFLALVGGMCNAVRSKKCCWTA